MRLPYCKATRIGINPFPDVRGARALPMTAPNARPGSAAFIAWPGVAELVSRSPTAMASQRASTLQKTLPISATAKRLPEDSCASRTSPGRYWPAPDTTPATFLSYASWLCRSPPQLSITTTEPGSIVDEPAMSKCSAQSAPCMKISPVTDMSPFTWTFPLNSPAVG